MSAQATRWGRVATAFLAGCIAAAQVGKAAAALSLVIDSFQLSLLEGSLVVSLFSVMAATTGVAFGLLADRFGHLRPAVCGLLLCAVAGLAGARSDGAAELLAWRAAEGLGFILAIVSLPPLISRSASDHDRPLAMGLWGAFMPAGIGAAMLVAPPILAVAGWRGLWDAVAAAVLLMALLLMAVFRGGVTTVPATAGRLGARLAAVASRGPLLLFGCFACYSALYVPLTSFFTTLAVSATGAELATASALGALVASANIVGNLAAGWLVRRGSDPGRLLRLAFIAMGGFGCVVFLEASPLWLKAAAGALFSGCGGLIPGTLFILAPRFAADPAKIAALSGVLLQGAGVGQALGPLLVGIAVDLSGSWSWASLNILVTAVVGVLLSIGIGRRVAAGP